MVSGGAPGSKRPCYRTTAPSRARAAGQFWTFTMSNSKVLVGLHHAGSRCADAIEDFQRASVQRRAARGVVREANELAHARGCATIGGARSRIAMALHGRAKRQRLARAHDTRIRFLASVSFAGIAVPPAVRRRDVAQRR